MKCQNCNVDISANGLQSYGSNLDEHFCCICWFAVLESDPDVIHSALEALSGDIMDGLNEYDIPVDVKNDSPEDVLKSVQRRINSLQEDIDDLQDQISGLKYKRDELEILRNEIERKVKVAA